MKLVKCYLRLNDDQSLEVPFGKDGDLYLIPISCVSRALGLTTRAVTKLVSEYEEDLQPLTLSSISSSSKRFFEENRDVMGIGRMRKDMIFLTLDAVIDICMVSRTEVSRQIRRQMREWYKSQIREEMISREEYLAMAAGFEQQLKEVRTELNEMKQLLPYVDKTASLAGSMLNAQRGTKAWRTN